VDTPFDWAKLKCDQLERELRRSPDFQLYLITKSPSDRARMERVLMEIPQFALWRALTQTIESIRLRERVLLEASGGSDALEPVHAVSDALGRPTAHC
jgi:hypothetical protein